MMMMTMMVMKEGLVHLNLYLKCQRATSRRREAAMQQHNKAVRGSSKAK